MTFSDPGTVLREHHKHLERVFQELVDSAETGDRDDLREAWKRFERELELHLTFEEEKLLPPFERDVPHAAATIRREHAQIRNALLDLGVRLDLHQLSSEAVQDFVAKLRAHAQHEDETLYPWILAHPPAGGWKSWRQQVESAFETLAAHTTP